MTRYEEGVLPRRATSGPNLYFRHAAPDDPKITVGVLHGYADHSARYKHVMDAWAQRGIECFAIDLRGHGLAEGERGNCERFSDYLEDVTELSQLMARQATQAGGGGQRPAFLFGHSFGGLVAASAVLEPRRDSPAWRGLVLSSPFFGVAMQVPLFKLLAGRVASRYAPWLAMPSGLHGSALTHDEAKAREYDQDPLGFKEVKSRWFAETHSAQERAIWRAPSLRLPFYLLIGGLDPVVSLDRARAFFDAAGAQDKTWDLRTGLFHEVLNEPEWRDAADRIADWMFSHA